MAEGAPRLPAGQGPVEELDEDAGRPARSPAHEQLLAAPTAQRMEREGGAGGDQPQEAPGSAAGGFSCGVATLVSDRISQLVQCLTEPASDEPLRQPLTMAARLAQDEAEKAEALVRHANTAGTVVQVCGGVNPVSGAPPAEALALRAAPRPDFAPATPPTSHFSLVLAEDESEKATRREQEAAAQVCGGDLISGHKKLIDPTALDASFTPRGLAHESATLAVEQAQRADAFQPRNSVTFDVKGSPRDERWSHHLLISGNALCGTTAIAA